MYNPNDFIQNYHFCRLQFMVETICGEKCVQNRVYYECRDKTMADKLMYIPNYFIQNYHYCRLQLIIVTFCGGWKVCSKQVCRDRIMTKKSIHIPNDDRQN